MGTMYPEGRDWRLSRQDNVPEAAAIVAAWRTRRSRAKYNESGNRKQWKLDHPEKVKAQKERSADRNYHRPFVGIDFEGANYSGQDIVHNGSRHPKHRAFLAGAGGWKRTNDAVALGRIGAEGNTNPAEAKRHAALMREGVTLDFDWLGVETKRPLSSVEIFEWFLSLPAKYGDVNFVMYAFDYDVTQALVDLPFAKVREICRRKKYDEDEGRDGESIGDSPVLWGPYAVSYIKAKVFKLWRLRDRDHPYVPDIGFDGRQRINKKTGRPKMKIDTSEGIIIYDAFGFYQEPFIKVSKSLLDNGYLAQAEHDIIVEQKANRAFFDEAPYETVKEYCGLELVALSKALTVLRDGFDQMGLRLRAWSGAGSAASALFRKEKLKDNHFPGDISTNNLPKWQVAAAHAYFGGNIQLIKQGCALAKPLFGYDIASAYPAATLDLPSMKGGTWSHVTKGINFNDMSFERLKTMVKTANILSMFLIRWNFPLQPKAAYDRKARQYERVRPFPFFPIPYRTKTGGILFPSAGKTWIMRDELIGALQWIETFFPDDKARDAINKTGLFQILGQFLFTPANDEKPFAFVRELYDLRARTPKTDTLNKAIKLCLNSLYGKLAQSVGGGEGKPPPSACPYYAAAITANCRMRLMLAALLAPYDAVMLATDGIISTKELQGLPRVIDTDANENPDLGDWEFARLGGGMFLQSGMYTLVELDGKMTVKTRGVNPVNVLLAKQSNLREYLVDNVLPQWRKAIIKDDKSTHPKLPIALRTYVTAGAAVASPRRFKIIGRWADCVRDIDIHTIGRKRDLLPGASLLYYSRGSLEYAPTLCASELADTASLIGEPLESVEAAYQSGEAFRCRMLVPTMPAMNKWPDALSGPRLSDWLDEDFRDRYEEELETANILMADAT